MSNSGKPSRTPPADASIVDRLAATGLKIDEVRLREPGSTAIPDDVTGNGRRAGRYRVFGEISAGGMGTILRARDPDLGRDVALKTLHAKYVGSPTMVQRFVEEAQIGGQLQHPGIVPVYDQEFTAEGRPWFAMKLVKGKTLAFLLGARKDPAKDRSRFLVLFDQVCQCVAYAHARGVIHRDLKPSNVMVGRFGEVQVLDWGFAKVLARGGVADEKRARREAKDLTHIATVRSEGGDSSVAGSLMGTPGYMAPEQALGHIEQLDERADVFALGSILCEILTGEPAFPERDVEALRRSAKGDLAETYARIRRSGAHRQLQALAIECLAPLRRDRPSDAAAIASAVEAFLASVDERQQQARLAQVEARSAARKARSAVQEARQKKWQTSGLAAAILVAATAGAWGFVSSAQERADKRLRVEQHTRAALDEAGRLERRDQWAAALAEAKRADETAMQAGLTGLSERAREISTRVEASRKAEQESEARAARREEIIRQLETARLRYFQTGRLSDAKRLFLAAFQECGVDPTRDTPSAAARTIRMAPLADHLIAALDDWALSAMKEGTDDHERLLGIARDADSDPWRGWVRNTLIARRLTGLQPAAKADETLEKPASSILLLARGLQNLGDEDGAVALLHRALPRNLPDFWLVRTLGEISRQEGDLRTALRCFTVAHALRPDEGGHVEMIDELIAEMERKGMRKPQ